MTPAADSHRLPIALTLGDPAGIGPEILVKAWRDAPEWMHGCFVAGDVGVMRRASQALAQDGLPALPVAELETAGQAWTAPPRCLPVLQVVQAPGPIAVGRISAEAGRVAGDAVAGGAGNDADESAACHGSLSAT